MVDRGVIPQPHLHERHLSAASVHRKADEPQPPKLQVWRPKTDAEIMTDEQPLPDAQEGRKALDEIMAEDEELEFAEEEDKARPINEADIPSPPSGHEYDRRVHVLGVGAVGTFIAHTLRGIPNPPPVTLLMYNRRQAYNFEQQGRRLEYTSDGQTDVSKDFDYERVLMVIDKAVDPEKQAEQEEEDDESAMISEPVLTLDRDPIMHLVVATKVTATVRAIRSVAHRLTPESTICFMQNGMGVVDEIDREVFPDPSTRPRYIQGILSHGLYQEKRFSVYHRSKGTITLSVLPVSQRPTSTSLAVRPPSDDVSSSPTLWPISARFLMRTLTRTTPLCALTVHPIDLLYMQTEKLAANCIINPLTTIYNCRNGDLGLNIGLRNVIRLLCAEISLVLRKLPELQPLGARQLESRFSPRKIEFAVFAIMKATAANHSSMWQDVFKKGSRLTEIDYMNGYIVRRGEELGIKCVCNYMVMQQVYAQMTLQGRLKIGLEPFEKFQELESEDQEKLVNMTKDANDVKAELPESYHKEPPA